MSDASREGTDTRLRQLGAGVGAALFDLDGVLIDTEPGWHEVRLAVPGADE